MDGDVSAALRDFAGCDSDLSMFGFLGSAVVVALEDGDGCAASKLDGLDGALPDDIILFLLAIGGFHG